MPAAPQDEAAADPLLLAVGRRIRELREAGGIKPADFARAAGITPQYLWRLEDGQQNLSLRSLSRLAIALDVTMAAILDGIASDPSTIAKRPYRKRTASPE